MKSFRILFALLGILLLTACPYSSVFKVGTPQIVEEALWNGTWVSQKMENGKMIKDELVFKKSGKNKLSVSTGVHVLSSERKSDMKLQGFPVSIGGKNWLLLYNSRRNSDKKYMYLGYQMLENDRMQLTVLSDEKVPETFTTAADFEKWLVEHQHENIWEDTLVFERQYSIVEIKK